MTGSMTFLINGSSAGSDAVAWVSITEQKNGSLLFNLKQKSGIVHDQRGLFFDLADKSLIGSLSVVALSTGLAEVEADDTGAANQSGIEGIGYDFGIVIKSTAVMYDNRSISFVIDCATRELTLSDFANVSFLDCLSIAPDYDSLMGLMAGQSIDDLNDADMVRYDTDIAFNAADADIDDHGVFSFVTESAIRDLIIADYANMNSNWV